MTLMIHEKQSKVLVVVVAVVSCCWNFQPSVSFLVGLYLEIFQVNVSPNNFSVGVVSYQLEVVLDATTPSKNVWKSLNIVQLTIYHASRLYDVKYLTLEFETLFASQTYFREVSRKLEPSPAKYTLSIQQLYFLLRKILNVSNFSSLFVV